MHIYSFHHWIIFILISIFNNINASTQPDRRLVCKGGQAEVVFLLDSSSSVGDDNFQKTRTFVQRLTTSFAIRPNATRVALISFATNVVINSYLNSTKDSANLLHQIRQIEYTKGETYTATALKLVQEKVFTQSRLNTPKLLILITDGRSSRLDPNFPAAKIASSMKRKGNDNLGVKFITIGITSAINEDELKAISSTGKFYKVDDYDHLINVLQNVAKETCEYVKIEKPKIEEEKCTKGQMEVVFLIDSSSSITPSDFKLEIGFVRSIVNTLEIGKELVRAAIVTFATEVKIGFELAENNSNSAVTRALLQISHEGGGTALGRALYVAHTKILHQARPGIPRIVIVITDGRNTDPGMRPEKMAKLMKDAGTKVFVVGVGNKINRYELTQLASTGKIYAADNFKELSKLVSFIVKDACSDA